MQCVWLNDMIGSALIIVVVAATPRSEEASGNAGALSPLQPAPAYCVRQLLAAHLSDWTGAEQLMGESFM